MRKIIFFFLLLSKTSFGQTTYEFNSSSSYFTTLNEFETYKLTYTPSSTVTLKLGTYGSPVDTMLNVYPSSTQDLSKSPRFGQILGTLRDDNLADLQANFPSVTVSPCGGFDATYYCSYLEKNLTGGTEYIIHIFEFDPTYSMTDGTTYVVSNLSDLVNNRTSYVIRVADKPSLKKILELLEQINTNRNNTSLTTTLDNLSNTNLETAANQIQGVTIERLNGQSFRSHSTFRRAVSSALTAPSVNSLTKNNYASLSLNDLNFKQDHNQYPMYSASSFDFKSMASFFKNQDLFKIESEGSTLLFKTFADQTNQDKVGTDIGYKANTAGFLLGNKNNLTDKIEQGWSLGLSINDTDFADDYGKSESNTFHATMYQNQKYDDLILGLNLGTYISRSDMDRKITQGSVQTLKSKGYNYGFDVTADIKQSYMLEDDVKFTPSFSTNIGYIIQDDLDETGGDLALSVKNENLLIIKPEIGFALDKNFQETDEVLESLNFSIYGSYEKKLDGTSFNATIKHTGSNFNIIDNNKDDTFVTVGLGYTHLIKLHGAKYNFGMYHTQNDKNNLNSTLVSFNYSKKF